MLTLCVFLFISFPFGVATASTIRVGNLLGAGLGQQVCIATRCKNHAELDCSSCSMCKLLWYTLGVVDVQSRCLRITVHGVHLANLCLPRDRPATVAMPAGQAVRNCVRRHWCAHCQTDYREDASLLMCLCKPCGLHHACP